MVKGDYCSCGCGVTPTNYRAKFKTAFPTGYPYSNSGMYYCGVCYEGMEWCKNMHIDHIKPKAIGGLNCIHNLRPLCAACNQGKGKLFTPQDKQLHRAGGMNTKKREAQKQYSAYYDR